MEKNFEGMTSDELNNFLQTHRIPIEQWGMGEAKSVQDLLLEIERGETTFVEMQGELFRHVKVLNLAIIHVADDGMIYRLYEDHQKFSDGRIRTRKRMLGTAVSEKMLIHEEPEQALQRALKEELQINSLYGIDTMQTVTETKESSSYPGLKTKYDFYVGTVTLSKGDYSPEGYSEFEESTGITTELKWKRESD